MRRILALLVLLCAFLPVVQAVEVCDPPHLSREEYRAKQKAFIIEKAGLTKKEAARFFPVYYELQDKKKKLNDDSWCLIRKGKENDVTELQYEEILDKIADNRIEATQLEKSYLAKFKKILSSKKIYMVRRAELRFHRELLKEMH